MRSLPDHFHPTSADSAGQSWSGRSFTENPFKDDDGTAPEAFVTAMAEFREHRCGPQEVVDALRGARVLIPLVAHLGEAGENDHGVTVDKSADLSIVTVSGPDGRGVLPVFTSAEAMRAWNPKARPVPALMQRAAIAAASEGSDLIVVDPVAETEFVIRRPAVWAIAQEQPWVPAWKNPAVAAEFSRILAEQAQVAGVDLLPGDPDARLRGPELSVTLLIGEEVESDVAGAALEGVRAAAQASEPLREQVDSLSIAVSRVKSRASRGSGASASRRRWWQRGARD